MGREADIVLSVIAKKVGYKKVGYLSYGTAAVQAGWC